MFIMFPNNTASQYLQQVLGEIRRQITKNANDLLDVGMLCFVPAVWK